MPSRLENMSDTYIIEVGSQTAGIVVRGPGGYRFFAASRRFDQSGRPAVPQCPRSRARGEASCHWRSDAGRVKRPLTAMLRTAERPAAWIRFFRTVVPASFTA
jgi:hypothetical protein